MVISRVVSYMNYPQRMCVLPSLDFFLWGFLKSQLYKSESQITVVLKYCWLIHNIGELKSDLYVREIDHLKFRISRDGRDERNYIPQVLASIAVSI